MSEGSFKPLNPQYPQEMWVGHFTLDNRFWDRLYQRARRYKVQRPQAILKSLEDHELRARLLPRTKLMAYPDGFTSIVDFKYIDEMPEIYAAINAKSKVYIDSDELTIFTPSEAMSTARFTRIASVVDAFATPAMRSRLSLARLTGNFQIVLDLWEEFHNPAIWKVVSEPIISDFVTRYFDFVRKI